jgi:hypothetical protein
VKKDEKIKKNIKEKGKDKKIKRTDEEISNLRKYIDEKNKLENILINSSKGCLLFCFDFNCLFVVYKCEGYR